MLTNFQNGITSFGVPVFGSLPPITGKYYHVNPKIGLSGNSGLERDQPVDSLKTAYDKCVTGDGIILWSYPSTTTSETSSYLSASLDWTKNGITVVGACAPSMIGQRARIANASTATTLAYLIDVQGIGNSFYNVHLFNGGSNVAALGALKVSGSRNFFYNCHVVGAGHATPSAAANAVNLQLVGASENTFEKCVFGTDTVNRVGTLETYDISFISGCSRNIFKDCMTLSQTTSGQTGHLAIKVLGAGDGINRSQYFINCLFHNYNEGALSAQTTLFSGTVNNGYILLHDCGVLGYADIDSTSAALVYTSRAASAADGGIMSVC